MFARRTTVTTRMVSHLAKHTWVCAALMIAGCDNSGGEPPVERVSVCGTVLLDGHPLAAGAIVFHGEKASAGATVTAYGFVEDGHYRIVAANGPPVGTARVEFLPKPLDRETLEAVLDEASGDRRRRPPQPAVVVIPDKYGEGSKLRVELISGDENRHDFALKSRS